LQIELNEEDKTVFAVRNLQFSRMNCRNLNTPDKKLRQKPQLCRSFFMMNMIERNRQNNWKTALTNKQYRSRFIAGLIVLTGIFCVFPVFFQHVQKRDGAVLHDYLLQRIPAVNVSILIFLCIWSTALVIIIRVIKSPRIFLHFLWTFIALSLFRMTTITTVALNPPNNLINLVDPLSNAFYGKDFITKDLFFSGHTATLFSIYFCLEKKADRIFALFTSMLVGVLVLFQHVHYSIDVLFAVPFAYISYWIGVKIAGFNKA